MWTWQSHTVLPFLKIAVTDDTHFSVILLFFVLFWFVLVDGKSPDILFRHASLFGTHSPCQHMNKLHKRATIAKLHNKRPRSPPITSIPSIHGSKLLQHHIHKIQRILLLSSFLDKRWKRLSLPLLKFWVHGGHFTWGLRPVCLAEHGMLFHEGSWKCVIAHLAFLLTVGTLFGVGV